MLRSMDRSGTTEVEEDNRDFRQHFSKQEKISLELEIRRCTPEDTEEVKKA